MYARQILDSRGLPDRSGRSGLRTGAGAWGWSPSAPPPVGPRLGASRPYSVYGGKGVLDAVKTRQRGVAPKVIGKDASDQRAL